MLRRLRTTRWLVLHAGLYVVLNAAFLAIWLLERGRTQQVNPAAQSDFWPAGRCSSSGSRSVSTRP